jgi:hypothetical protein
MYRIVESAEDVIKVCEFFGCHAQLDSSPTCPLSHNCQKLEKACDT